jgi:hypothetical protein
MHCGCGVYTFSNTALPAHIKTIEIPLLENETGKPGVADEITQLLTRRVRNMQQVRLVTKNADATIDGNVLVYERRPRTYKNRAAREVTIEEYVVYIQVRARFMDNRKNNALFEGVVTGEGIYEYDREEEEAGRERAIEDLVSRIMRKSLENW